MNVFGRLAKISAILLAGLSPVTGVAQGQGPLRIEITEGVIEPLPIAITPFVSGSGDAAQFARDITQVIIDDLEGSGLFRAIDQQAFISQVSDFNAPLQYADWKAINAQGVVTGEVTRSDENLSVKFRLFDVFSEVPLGDGLQFGGSTGSWRRMAHKVADAVYSRITGEGGYFDSRVIFVSEAGPKDARQKRLAVMDYDGANLSYLTDSSSIVLAPRISRDGSKVVYTSYASGEPRIYILDTSTLQSRALGAQSGPMTFSPRFSPDGSSVLFSQSNSGNTDLFVQGINGGGARQLTSSPSIDTSPSYSPEGDRIVFESDRSGSPQLYVMPAAGGEAQRISFGEGRYGTPVWSPRGDLIAFTKQNQGRFHIGVMRPDGSEERLLTASFLDEGPTWAPNGRVVMFSRETPGSQGNTALYSVDITGRNLKRVSTPGAASDPAWSPLLD
ncbi:Tol-Pal system beta propeller repeat protein TolB [Qingshengfaniella alkalisoli]|uniref:Tol-Pal system protein TolB n=1 Tax=Qingshengfaniella alkalisoli TaxID=2599296 RepID=A0A5B8I7H1_9RHOB|nr:Tol-Pal system beta propeller repeat protein TolB [Qingshengfaniella alkalisoli]QDY69529.1 Tol-Pal system protein TolB [Qingshengfaniella alkalisoli]